MRNEGYVFTKNNKKSKINKTASKQQSIIKQHCIITREHEVDLHENSRGLSSTTNPKPRGHPPSACSGTLDIFGKRPSHLGA